MNKIREFIQSKFNEIINLDSGLPIADDVIENSKTYFGYELQEDYQDSDMDKNYTMQISLTGRIVRKESKTENTLEIIDNALNEIKSKLKELNFKYSYRDISLDNGVRKIFVTGYVRYNEINKKLIV